MIADFPRLQPTSLRDYEKIKTTLKVLQLTGTQAVKSERGVVVKLFKTTQRFIDSNKKKENI